MTNVFVFRGNKIFTFASNLAGNHWGGSAAHAHKEHGAIWGESIGHHGNSYAIPTLNHEMQQMALYDINVHVNDFIEYASRHHELTFNVVAIGCGIAGFSAVDIAPMFADAPDNCNLPPEFINVLGAR